MKLSVIKNTTILLLGIIILASFLRFWQLGQVPGSIDWDEAANGYNAYSIMLTGRDEYGTFMPVVMRSFGDYKPALYSYLIVPFIPVFDLSPLAVRLPSAIAGIIAVIVTYVIVCELTKRKDVALLSSFLLAISPWHIQFSRVGFESNVGLMLNLCGILFFLKGLKKPWLLSLSAIFFAISLYAYQSEKVFVPLLLLVLIGVFWKKLFTVAKQYLLVSLIVLFIVSLPIVIFTLTNKAALSRAQGVSIMSSQTKLLQNDITRLEYDKQHNDILGFIFDNRRVIYAKTVLDGYLSHFDLNWLFFKGDATARHHAPSMGLLYVIELPFLLLGIYLLLFGKSIPIDKRTKYFLLLWLFITPIPASITTGVPHAVRTLNFLPTFQIFTAIGLITAWKVWNRNQEAEIRNYGVKILTGIFLILSTVNVVYYLDQYFVQQNYFTAQDWQYGYKQLVDYIKPIHNNYQKVIVSDTGDFDQSYIFFLFYLKYNPQQYLAGGGSNTFANGQGGHAFSNFAFRKFDYNAENNLPLLFVGSSSEFPSTVSQLKTITYPNGQQAMMVIEKK